MKCRGVKKTRELVTRYCIFEEKREAVAEAAASFFLSEKFEKETGANNGVRKFGQVLW